MTKPIEHKHLIIRAETQFSPNKEQLKDWIANLIQDMDMECISGPHTEEVLDEGNVGPTGVAILSTSHCAVHIWTEPELHDLWQIDFYTCGSMDVDKVISHLYQYTLYIADVKLFDREYNLTELEIE